MFFHISLSKNVSLHPRLLGPNIHKTLRDRLHSEVEGTCSGRYGFIVTVTSLDLERLGKGRVQEGTGHVVYTVHYQAIVFRPFKGEVLDAVVAQVNKHGFFADAGPLKVFVSKHLIPNELAFDAHANPPCFASADGSVRLEPGAEVRLRLVGTRVDANEIFAIGSIKEDYLGLIQ